jgi:hypothetical protein
VLRGILQGLSEVEEKLSKQMLHVQFAIWVAIFAQLVITEATCGVDADI